MIDNKIKNNVLKEYLAGKPVNSICTKYNVARSTIYDWIKKRKIYRDTKTQENISYYEYQKMKKELALAQQSLNDYRPHETLKNTLQIKLKMNIGKKKIGQSNKNCPISCTLCIWRRKRDLNPRYAINVLLP